MKVISDSSPLSSTDTDFSPESSSVINHDGNINKKCHEESRRLMSLPFGSGALLLDFKEDLQQQCSLGSL